MAIFDLSTYFGGEMIDSKVNQVEEMFRGFLEIVGKSGFILL